MPEVNPKTFHMSASSITAFKACATRFRLAYREGLRLVEDTESQRMGSNWHSMHETYANALKYHTPTNDQVESDEDARLIANELALAKVIEHLNERYVKCPQNKTLAEWSLERQVLLTSFIGYLWRWSNDPVEVLASEVPFNLPIYEPKTGLPLPMSQVQRVGKIDHIVRWQGSVCCLERKSTSRSIEPDSDYWDKSKKDTQVSMYALAMRDLQYKDRDGGMWLRDAANETLLDFGPSEQFGNTLYDVWHKPTIKPKMLTQAETAEFVAGTMGTVKGMTELTMIGPNGVSGNGVYFDQQFAIEIPTGQTPFLLVNGERAEIEYGKKGFAIRETVEMFAARLLNDIYTRPDFYYQRREIARTDQELAKFRKEGYAIYQTQRTMDQTGHWFENESACRATFPCSYIPICYGPGADAVCDGNTTPNGFKRIFVDLTVKGEVQDE